MDDRQRLLELIRAKAVLRGDFILSSGNRSSYYIDARKVTLSGEGSRLIGSVVSDMIGPDSVDVIAGLTLGADPVVTAVALTSTLKGRKIDGLLIRKQPKEHGTGRLIEGPATAGLKAVVVEDTSTTGASALQAARTLQEQGIEVRRVITIIDRDEGAREAVNEADLRFDAVFSIAEVLEAGRDHAGQADMVTTEAPLTDETSKHLLLYTDGASTGNPGPGGAGFLLLEKDQEVKRGSKSLGRVTNNVAEYRALLLGMTEAKSAGATHLTIRMDSELVVKQMLGKYKVKHPDLLPLFAQAKELAAAFRSVRFQHVLRDKNQIADSLAAGAARGR